MKVAVCQFNVQWDNPEANKQKILQMVDAFPGKGSVDWIVFPEMTLSGFSMTVEKTTLRPQDKEFFIKLAKDCNCAISYGGVENGYNNLITLDKTGAEISNYSKIHQYSFGKENSFYKAGNKVDNFSLNGFSVTPAICFDLRFPYLFWNAAAKTDIYVVIAGWPARRADHWMTMLKARALENQCYIIGVNCLGKDPDKIDYSGNSMVFDPLGKVVVDAKEAEGIFTSDIAVEKELVTRTRTRFPFLNDRRPGKEF